MRMDASRAGTALRVCGALLLVSLIGHTIGARANDQAPPKKPSPQVACVKSQSEARFDGYGYDHWVHLTNACKVAVRCSVKTNANPEGTVVELGVGEQKSVMTFMGSPAREFTVEVSCQRSS
jgi:hypothetical protein